MAPSRYEEAAGLPIPEADCRALIEAAASDNVPAAPEEALALARTLTGLYRRAEFEDAALFCTGLAALFAAYPASLGRQVVDPVRGLPARQKFPPALAEVREALDAAQCRRNAVAWRARYLLEERARREAEAARPTASAGARAATLEKLRALRVEPGRAAAVAAVNQESADFFSRTPLQAERLGGTWNEGYSHADTGAANPSPTAGKVAERSEVGRGSVALTFDQATDRATLPLPSPLRADTFPAVGEEFLHPSPEALEAPAIRAHPAELGPANRPRSAATLAEQLSPSPTPTRSPE
ncbi:hypothetical protein [Labrys miyagiensis]|nr:hypothetical protein [Labrys miyagiensis]